MADRWMAAAIADTRPRLRAPTSCHDLAMPNTKKAIASAPCWLIALVS